MIKDNRGTSAFFLLMMFILFFILGMALSIVLTQVSDDAQNISAQSDGITLDCGNATSYQDKANCTSTDSLPWFYTAIVFGFAGAILAGIRNG